MKYNVGIYGGSFNPLHLGHVRCILEAANQCRELYIILSVGINRKEIDKNLRYRWLYMITSHIGNTKILFLSDEAVTKSKYTEENWFSDAYKVKNMIGKPIDVVFCGDDYDEGSYWNLCYPESQLVVFRRNGLNSTSIRQDPYRFWDWLPNLVRPYYVKKVLLIGGESTGKSTLTINLAHYYNTNYVEEVGRDISERSGTDMLMLSQDFTEILLRHKLKEIEAVSNSNKVLFVDTDCLVTRFYMSFLNDPMFEQNAQIADAINSVNRFDLILFLEPDVDFVQDGDRSTVIKNDREKYSRAIKNLLMQCGKKFHSISGSYEERFLMAVSLIDEILGNNELKS